VKYLKSAPWALTADNELAIDAAQDREWLYHCVCAPQASIRTELMARGFLFRDKPQRGWLRAVLADAASLLHSVPRLEIAIRTAVREIVLLGARPAYDISHSEPRWPHTIFISLPSRPCQVTSLRATESIVHEAMHLQLTRFELLYPLVANGSSRMASPWRKEPRPLQGVLHGYYVFCCIGAFFADVVLRCALDADGTRHVARRRAQIADELSRIDFDKLWHGMTPIGRAFIVALRNDVDVQIPDAISDL
jgi:HEXXH motif-containing protein